MINIKVKTIAGIDRSFDVSGDLTVKQFKEHIADNVNVPAPNQRIIYHGRILDDEKVLNALDLDGKTLHLVEKSPSQANSVPQNNVLPPSSPRRTLHEIAERQVIIGTVAVPVSELNEQEIRISMNRVLNRLGRVGRNAGLTIAPTANAPNSLEMSLTLRDRAPVDVESPAHAILHNVEHILDDIEHLIEHLECDDPDSRHRLLEDSPSGYPHHSAEAEERADEAPGNGTNEPRIVEASTRYFANVFDRFLALQDRLRGHFSRYSRLLSSDPVYTDQQTSQRDNDGRFFEIIQSVMHMQSHAFHCLSELAIDFDHEPPRTVSPTSPPQATTVIRPPEARVTMHFVRQSDIESGRLSGRPSNVNATPTTAAQPHAQAAASINRAPSSISGGTINPTSASNAQVFFQAPTLTGAQAASFVIPAGEFNLNLDSLFGGSQRQPSSAPTTTTQTSTGQQQQQQQTVPFLQRIFGSLIPGAMNMPGSNQPTTNSTGVQSQTTNSSIFSPLATGNTVPHAFVTSPIATNQPRAQIPGIYDLPQTISVPVSVTIGRTNGLRQQQPGTGMSPSILPGYTPRFLYTGESGSRPVMHALNRNANTALYHVDPFLPCSSRHFAHRRRFSSSASDASSNQNEPSSPVSRTVDAEFDMREFEETMEQLLRTVLDNMRSSQGNVPSHFLADGNIEPQRTRHAAERYQRPLQNQRSHSFPSSPSVPAASPQTSAPSSRLANPVINQGATYSSSPTTAATTSSSTPAATTSSSSVNQADNQWKIQVPEQEWIEVIESDRVRQETMAPKPRTSFSDAYLDGMPAKRRKMIAGEKIDLTSSMPTVMQSIAAQYFPTSRNGSDQQQQSSTSSLSDMNLGDNMPDNSGSTVQQQLRERMGRRARFDPNPNDEKCKNSRQFLEK